MRLSTSNRRIKKLAMVLGRFWCKLENPLRGQGAAFNHQCSRSSAGKSAVASQTHSAGSFVVRNHTDNNLSVRCGFARRCRCRRALFDEWSALCLITVVDSYEKTRRQQAAGHAGAHDAKSEDRDIWFRHSSLFLLKRNYIHSFDRCFFDAQRISQRPAIALDRDLHDVTVG